MKVSIDKEVLKKALEDETVKNAAKVKVSDPWWVITLKVLAYLIGLLLAGVTTSCAAMAIL